MKWSSSVLLLLAFTPIGAAGEPLFDNDARHIWNRLHRHLHTRVVTDGNTYETQGLEPALVRQSAFLVSGESHVAAITLLDEFLNSEGHAIVTDPIRRAILQRDLWAIFVTTADASLPNQKQRRALQKRLAQVMRQIALSPEEIERLPNNLQLAVDSRRYPVRIQSKDPATPFLPTDLADPNGEWVLVRSRLRRDDIAAPLHVHATLGRSIFLLLLRLPDGRGATLKYVAQLKALPKEDPIPQFPTGTQVALLRRMLLINQTGELQLSPVTESLQMRVYQNLKAPEAYEFRLRRKGLIDGHGAGFTPTRPDESDVFNLGHLGFSMESHRDPIDFDYPPGKNHPGPVVMKSCTHCHAGPGVFGLQSMFVDHFERPPFDVAEPDTQILPVLSRTAESYTWGLLQGLWEQ